ncbi:hypothetical protein DTO013E5_5716 [Penicillium roqueforti]|uniref:DNA mismatch repair protein n=1 Tax=Penicillium roqueforti (strain FM164) TaxID=1365484 RepID=W6Q8U7_PENRF|nr:uncharacterized protein LCP9604111_7942 [Penicillium roqueforti]CDM33093.1 DNA mismatch repair protein [Penicillium roqueforti FM164]KAF9242759.1 hypothetical protein LCP9604111_7942 [Penicillium roqueforti]KAI1830535.1 hypothetical protein CBS147337_8601 [Penicillium roqueforti]KAI2674381.1 hypothetical protein CBS147355_6995 [Penicillium roqueforti]KAI2710582.1 hypothetical protein CBS147318_8603 [Penicillium roqueforti]
MTIEALPQKTIRAIGSTSAISDPCSVVKELVDNALDASATSLQVEISQNTVDVIQLKDNGHGISPEDQQNVCKRAFTSKIQSLDDLKNVGGSSLGFRGEALASVAEMSGLVTVTTRVESEVAGRCLKYGRNGELTGTQRTSHPVGTTVRIAEFLKHIPVRRQTILKGAAKSLTKIKKLLQAYAIAQPLKRFSFKVLKTKGENSNWVYVPSADASLSDAVLKIAGTEVFSSCVLKEKSDQTGYEAAAFLPKNIQLDTAKINNAGQFISVDGRPLSNSRGVAHEIVKNFKQHLRVVLKESSDPFLCLQIRCPRGTYDVNIEPGKDNILFEDQDIVLALVENMFRDHYGTETRNSTQGKENSCKPNESSGGFELLLARKPAELAAHPGDPDNPFSLATPCTPLSQNPQALSPPVPSSTVRSKQPSFVNPWSVSRINASFQTPRRGNNYLNQTSPVDLSSGSLQEPIQREGEPRVVQHSPNSAPISPLTSRLASGSPVKRRRQHPQESTECSPETNRISSARRAQRERDRDRYGNGALDTWFQRTTQVSLQKSPTEEAPTQEPDSPLSFLTQQRFGLPTNNLPDIMHIDGQNDGCSDSPDLEKALDFERRKKEAIQNSRMRVSDNEKTSSSQSAPEFHSPHKSRYLAAKAALTSSQASVSEPVSATTLSPRDPRAYLIRQARDHSTDETFTKDGKAKRLPTNRLPFERIPDGSDLHDLGLTLSVDLSSGSNLFKCNISENLYTENDNETTAFSTPDLETCVPFWNEQLMLLMKQKYKNMDQSKPLNMHIDLATIISPHVQIAQSNSG